MALKRLYVGGLHPDIKEEELVSRFSRFGCIQKVELKIRKDDSGVPTKTFAYMNMESTDADLQKCYSTYNRSKWKGSELIIQVAKENFLERLEKERKMSLEEKEATPKAPEPVAPLKKPGEVAGVENFQLKAPPGTVIPGEKDWVVGKYGRVLPVVHIRKKGSRKTLSVDPSKFTHNVKTFKDDAENDGESVQRLTWELKEKDDELTRKRKGDFPKWKSPKKTKRGSKDVISYLNEKEQERRIEAEVEVVPVLEDASTVSEFVSQTGNKPSAGQMDLSKFDSESDEESSENQSVICTKDKTLLKKQNISVLDKADKKIRKDNPVEKPKRKLCDFKGTKQLGNFVENNTSNVNENTNENVNTGKPVRKLKEFRGTKMLDKAADENEGDLNYCSSLTLNRKDNDRKRTPTASSNTNGVKGCSSSNFHHLGNLKPHVLESDSSLKVYSIDDFSSVFNLPTQYNVSTDEDDESDFETLVKREEAKLKGNRNIPKIDKTVSVISNQSYTKKVYHSSDSDDEPPEQRVNLIEGHKKIVKNAVGKTKNMDYNAQTNSGPGTNVWNNTAENKSCTDNSESSVSENDEKEETISEEDQESESSSEDDRDLSDENSDESSDSSAEVNTDPKLKGNYLAKSKSPGGLVKGDDDEKVSDENDDITDDENSDGSDEDEESDDNEDEESSDEDEVEDDLNTESESDDSDFEMLVAKEVNKVDSSNIQNNRTEKKVTPTAKMNTDEKDKQKAISKSLENKGNDADSDENESNLTKRPCVAHKRLSKEDVNNDMPTVVKANTVQRPEAEMSKDDDKKRREAVKQRQRENLAQKSAIQTALANMDAGVTSNKKIVFDSDSDEDVASPAAALSTLQEDSDDASSTDSEASETETGKPSVGTGLNLFDSSDDEDSDDNDGDRFDIRPQFEGSAGEKLMKLQSRYGNDERFKLDKRFEEPDSDKEEVDAQEEKEMGSDDEKVRAFKILQSIVGTPVSAPTAREKEKKKFKDMSSLKYDPSKEDHSQFEIKSAPKSEEDKNRKKKKKDKEQEPQVEIPEVSKEKFYEMSENLREQFIAKATTDQPSGQGFSLLAAFGRHSSDDEETMQEEEAIPIQSSLSTDHLSLDNRFKVTDDHSDSDQESVTLTDEEGASQEDEKTAQPLGSDKPKQLSVQTFFFTEDDERLKEGEKFYRTDDADTVRNAWNKTRRDYIESYRFKQKRVKRQARSTPVAKRGRRK